MHWNRNSLWKLTGTRVMTHDFQERVGKLKVRLAEKYKRNEKKKLQ